MNRDNLNRPDRQIRPSDHTEHRNTIPESSGEVSPSPAPEPVSTPEPAPSSDNDSSGN